MTQRRMFWDSQLDAIQGDVDLLGGRKKVAPRLFCDCDEETAQDRMKACLSRGHRMEFPPAALTKLKRWTLEEFGYSCQLDWEAQELGFKYETINPRDESDALKREFIDGVRVLSKLAERIERAESRAQLQSVEGGRR